MKYLILGFIFAQIACKKVEVRDLPSKGLESRELAPMTLQPYLGLKGHSCKWVLCPYKGISLDSAHKYVLQYVGNDKSPGYSLDILHLQHPTAEYEELETMLNED